MGRLGKPPEAGGGCLPGAESVGAGAGARAWPVLCIGTSGVLVAKWAHMFCGMALYVPMTPGFIKAQTVGPQPRVSDSI